jgi:N-formylglutamate amidohydrolase
MDSSVDATPAHEAFEILPPERQELPVVLASPHSGRSYPSEFLDAARLHGLALRKSEDTYVDEIFAEARGLGVPMIRALVPRAYLDLNREAFELDPEMFAEPLPAYVNTRSPRVQAGLGTIARVVATGEEIYGRKLRFDEALDRVNRVYHPYHAALRSLVDRTRARFGWCILVDCHSMPSSGAAPDGTERRMPADVVLGDCYGSACAASVTDAAEASLGGLGYAVARNSPYAGGYTTRHYGRPREGVHAIQVELNRALYMDEARMARRGYLDTLARHMTALVRALGALDLRPGA